MQEVVDQDLDARSEQFAQRACELSQWESPSLIATLAAAHAAQGNEKRAADLLDRCLSLLPQGADSRSLYAGLRNQYIGDGTSRVADNGESDVPQIR